MKDRYYTVEEVANLLSVHPETVRRWIKAKKLKSFKLNNSYRVEDKDLEAFIKGA